MDIDAELDVCGLNCPLPILKTKKRLVTLEPGQVLRVQATDPHSVIDFMAFCEKTGTDMLDHGEQEGVYEFILRKPSKS